MRARKAAPGSRASGKVTMQSTSTIAITGKSAITLGPPKRNESSIGNTMAAEDDAMMTAYSIQCSSEKILAKPRPRPTAVSTIKPTLARPPRKAGRIRSSRMGTWLPATNITMAKPI